MYLALDAYVCRRPTLEDTLAAVSAHGIRAVQWSLACIPGIQALPRSLSAESCAQVRSAADAAGLRLASVSGTYNMAHPDPAHRAEGARRLRGVIAACPRLGADIVTLCTGTRNQESMWSPHPDNGSPEAWRDLLESLASVLPEAEAQGVTLAVEPEVSNVIDSAARARRLLDEVGSPRLGVCIDGANLFHTGELPRMDAILDEAFSLLGRDIVLAHAKDLDHDGAAGDLPAGHGHLDYPHYLGLLHGLGFAGAVVLHGLSEDQVDGCSAFVRTGIAAAERAKSAQTPRA
jgi:sugar phosphate isomerase/epimerase